MKQSVAGSSIGPTLGNGIAYFLLWWLANKHGINFEDPEMALLFAGGVIGSLLLELRRMAGGIGAIFNRFFPPKAE
jgi:hypothetical protein